jgi:hypothetical protein
MVRNMALFSLLIMTCVIIVLSVIGGVVVGFEMLLQR